MRPLFLRAAAVSSSKKRRLSALVDVLVTALSTDVTPALRAQIRRIARAEARPLSEYRVAQRALFEALYRVNDGIVSLRYMIRVVDRQRDRRAISAIDTSFETSSVFDVVVSERALQLVERPLPTPITKRYPMGDAFAAWSTWDTGFCAEDLAGVYGFVAVEYEAWHARLVLWHLYVDRARRREGIGRALLERVEAHGKSLGAERVWLETTSVNVPGIAAYARLGYELVGLDTTVYDTLPYADEAALYLAKRL